MSEWEGDCGLFVDVCVTLLQVIDSRNKKCYQFSLDFLRKTFCCLLQKSSIAFNEFYTNIKSRKHTFQSVVFVHLFSFSDINSDAVDLVKYPDFAKIPWSNFTVHAGDCLFLPKSKKTQCLLFQNLPQL